MTDPETFVKVIERPTSERKKIGHVRAVDSKGNVRERPIYEMKMGMFDEANNLLHEASVIIHHMGKRV